LNVLFDEDVPGKLARFLPQHEIHTVVSMQWGGIKNGMLLFFAYANVAKYLMPHENPLSA
jgi:hypothetical protein